MFIKTESDHMTTQIENKDKAEQKVSKDELSEKELEKATGGTSGTSGGTVAAKWNLAQGKSA